MLRRNFIFLICTRDTACWFGYNRDKEDLPQVNLGMFSSIKSKKPLYYSMYNGSLNDSTQLPYVINDAKRLGISTRNVCTFDRGFFSQKGITFLDNAGLKSLLVFLLAGISKPLRLLRLCLTLRHIGCQNMNCLNIQEFTAIV